MNDKHDVIKQYLGDMLAVEQHIHQALQRQINTDSLSNFPEAAQLISRAEKVSESHASTIENHIKALDGATAAPVKEAVMAALGVLAGFVDKMRTDEVSKMLRDDYTAFSLAAISYHMLHTTAVAFDDQTTASLALRHLKDWTRIITDISHVIHHTVARDLADNGFTISQNAAKRSEEATQEAWNPAHVS